MANLLLTQSYRLADASLVSPIKYLSLLFALFFGFYIWNEIPKPMMLFGALLVIISSLIIFRRETSLNKQVVPPRARRNQFIGKRQKGICRKTKLCLI